MVNGKPQIYFDALGLLIFYVYFLFINKFFLDESPIKPKSKRSNHPITTPRLPEQPKSKPTSQKPLPQNQSNKQPKKTNKVTFSDDKSTVGVFMTMDEISELVKAVKETTQAHENKTTESKGRMIDFCNVNFHIFFQEPPPSPPFQQQQRFTEVSTTIEVPKSDVLPPPPPPPLAPISPRQEALGMMADKKRQKWMREKGKNYSKINLNYQSIL
jgi:hypothetical protein